jgi:protease-4
MKSLIRIQEAVYNRPWLILPSIHETIRKQLELHIAGGLQMPINPMDDEDEDEDEELKMAATSPYIEIINIEGIIGKRLSMLEMECGGCDVDMISDQLDEAVENPDVSEIVLYINSPGGTVIGVPELAAKIAEIDKKKRCTAFVDVLCASAAFYIASQCSQIFCTPSAEIGSVGVYSIYIDETRMLENAGVKVNAISAGTYKLTGASFKVMTEEERSMLQADVDNIYNQFKAAVTSKREIKDEYLQGQVFNGEQAVMNNFADGNINSMSELMKLLMQDNKI